MKDDSLERIAKLKTPCLDWQVKKAKDEVLISTMKTAEFSSAEDIRNTLGHKGIGAN